MRFLRIASCALAGTLLGAAGPGLAAQAIERLDGTTVSVRAIEREIATVLEEARLPGLQIAVINRGDVAFTAGFGDKQAGADDAVGPETVFAALSFSKTLFAYLVMQLVDEGVLDLDAPLASYLPRPLPSYEFYRDLEDEPRYAALTARMALSHTTGFPNWRWFTPDGVLRFVYEPGERFSYSGEGIRLLQLVVEEITGSSLEELAHARILEPLGLARTSFVFRLDFEADYATDHDRFLSPIGKEKRTEANAAGSAQTTAADFARFLAAVMRGQGLSSTARNEMLSPQVTIEHTRMFGPLARVERTAAAPQEVSWGLGWGLVESEHGRAFFHTGNDRGAANYHIAFPDRGIAVVLLGNSQTLEAAAPALTRFLIGDAYSPFDFLGYEPYDSPRHRMVRVIVGEGVEAGLAFHRSLSAEQIGRWHADDWAFLDGVGIELFGLRRYREVAELYRSLVAEHPSSAAHEMIAMAYAALGEYEPAGEAYRLALASRSGDTEDARRLRWMIDWVDGLAAPLTLSEEQLREYAGGYGARHIDLIDGELFYYRDDIDDRTVRRLYAISDEHFVLEGVDFFRLRFDRDSNGRVIGITGLYLDGREDESPRDPPP